MVALLKDRATSIVHLAEAATLFYGDGEPEPALARDLASARDTYLRTSRMVVGR